MFDRVLNTPIFPKDIILIKINSLELYFWLCENKCCKMFLRALFVKLNLSENIAK